MEFLSRKWCNSRHNALKQRINSDPVYAGCSLHPDWKCHTTFYAWIRQHAVEDWALDKDLLVPGNKVYGPDTCIYVPRKLNNAFKRPYRKSSNTPPNVHPWKGGKWRVCLVVDGKTRSYGVYECLETASLVAQRESLRYQYSVVRSYKDDPRLSALVEVLTERLKNQALILLPQLVAQNLK